MMMRKRRAMGLANTGGEISTHTEYPHRLNFYNIPPGGELTIDDFEGWAVDRLRILSKLNTLQSVNTPPKDVEREMRPLLAKYLPLTQNSKNKQAEAERRKDHYSHFILRLCFSRSPDLQAKFVAAEKQLFKLRFNTCSDSEKREFIDSLPLNLCKLSPNEMAHIPERYKTGDMFRVDWTRVPDLVQHRNVYLRGGFAYIAQEQLVSLLSAEFAADISASMVRISRVVGRIDESDRLMPILDHMSNGFNWSVVGADVKVEGDITADQINAFDKKNLMPLCMSMVHRHNLSINHAKFNSRTYFTVFLKHMGMPVDQALLYWSQIFRNADDRGKKDYVYYTQFKYGLKGSKKEYSSPKCYEIARLAPTAEDRCACPFKSLPAPQLREELAKRGVSDKEDLNYIEAQNKANQFHLSCSRVYERTHPADNKKYDGHIMSPNEYFARAYEAEKIHAQRSR